MLSILSLRYHSRLLDIKAKNRYHELLILFHLANRVKKWDVTSLCICSCVANTFNALNIRFLNKNVALCPSSHPTNAELALSLWLMCQQTFPTLLWFVVLPCGSGVLAEAQVSSHWMLLEQQNCNTLSKTQCNLIRSNKAIKAKPVN